MQESKTTKYKIGRFRKAKPGELSAQRIDFGKTHFGKIVVYDTGCKTIARRIIKCLNKQ